MEKCKNCGYTKATHYGEDFYCYMNSKGIHAKKQFTSSILSEKIGLEFKRGILKEAIHIRDVKEFIRNLKEEDWDFYDKYIRDKDLDKEEIVEVCFKYFNKKIDKLAGKDLI